MLANLPEISFVDTDPAAVEQAVITTYEGIAGVTLYPGDPVRLFLSALALLIAQQRSAIDVAAKRNLLAYADGDFLDHLGVMTNTTRLAASPALATVRFSLAEALAFAVTILAGTRVTPGNQIYFEVTTVAEIAIGETYVDVTVSCMTDGTVGNGFVAGQINKLVDPIAYIDSVANTTTSAGGAEEESDADYRDRIRLSPERYSVAGPRGAYEYFAKSAHQDIADVSVVSPTAGEVYVYVLLTGGELPDAEMLGLVEDAVKDEERRPLTDSVTVAAPTPVSYDIDIDYYIDSEDAASAAIIQADVDAAVDAYVVWQKSAIGRDINPSKLVGMIMAAGAKRADVTAPVFTTLDVDEVAAEGTVTATYGGLEDA